MHDILFDRQSVLENADLLEYANNIGVDLSQFLRDLSRRVYRDRVNQDIESGL